MTTVGEDYVRIQDQLAADERWLTVVYVVGALCFSVAIFNFRKPSTAPVGNVYAILGMVIALAGTLASVFVNGYGYYIFLGIFLGLGLLGLIMGLNVKMTSMPIFVGFLNSMGGLAAALESLALYVSPMDEAQQQMEWQLPWGMGGISFQVYNTIFYLLGMIIGTMTFTGSITACIKLRGHFKFAGPKSKKIYRMLLKGRAFATVLLGITITACAVVSGVVGLGVSPVGLTLFIVSMVVTGLYGIYFVLCIGGADMPVVISLLNSLSGWSTVFAGLAFGNELMLIAGCFVGASGLILSVLMCRAMNRSLQNVLIGGFGGETEVSADASHLDAHVVDSVHAAKIIADAKLIYVVPGYGMAVSQAQRDVAALGAVINASGRECRFAVHPVAGRLPGHMNVLLAEADVPYNYVDDISANQRIKEADLVIVVGANDIYNPAAKFDKGSNIYGMEVLEVWEAKRTIVVKRSLRTGYAGIDNELFYYPHNSMLLGDASEVICSLTTAVRNEFDAKDPDAVEAFVSADDQRIGVRREEDKLLKANTSQEVFEVIPLIVEEPLPLTLGILREPEDRNDDRIPSHPKDVAAILNSKPWNIGRVVVEKHRDDPLQDEPFANAGATIVDRSEVLRSSDVVVSMSIPPEKDIGVIAKREMSARTEVPETELTCQVLVNGQPEDKHFTARCTKPIIISLFGNPSGTKDAQEFCASKGVSLVSLDIMPRVTTAQVMDVLSSTAKVAGFRSVIEACNQYSRLIGAEITAAGSYRPAKCLVIGCGVAGLQVVGDMHRLGAEVRAFDVRKECADQVKSMGGKFLLMDFGDEQGAGAGGYANIMSDEFIKKEMELLFDQSKECDIFILTAAIPGRKAPILIKDYHVEAMKAGAVIIDLAAPTGGNCEVTRPHENYVTSNGVKVIGKVDFVKDVSAPICSEMLSANVMNWFTFNMTKAGTLNTLDVREPLIRAVTLVHQGECLWPAPRPPAPAAPVIVDSISDDEDDTEVKVNRLARRHPKYFNANWTDLILFVGMLIVFGLLAWSAPVSLTSNLMVLVLACWTGYLLVCGVTVALHTPLMSLTNAISGIVIVAAMLSVSPMLAANVCDDAAVQSEFYCQPRGTATIVIDSLALGAASLNVVGGFAVTHRMLGMFRLG